MPAFGKLGWRTRAPGLPAFGKLGWRTAPLLRGLGQSMEGLRIDKWLWAARFFKTRALAARACDLGRIQCNRQPAKPAREVRVSDFLHIRTDHNQFEVEVLQLSAIRGPASVAQTLYRETDASRDLRLKLAAERKAMINIAPAPPGRPSKRDRRRIIQFRDRHERDQD